MKPKDSARRRFLKDGAALCGLEAIGEASIASGEDTAADNPAPRPKDSP